MISTTTTIILCGILILLTLMNVLTNPFLWFRKDQAKQVDASDNPVPMSIILMAEENDPHLKDVLKALQTQAFGGDYQIVIVANEGDGLVDTLLKQNREDGRIQSTFIPKSARYISRRKLGMTLGVKAAANEWCIVLDSSTLPMSMNWLQTVSARCTDDRDIVMCYRNYAPDAAKGQRFYTLRHFAELMAENRFSQATCSNGCNIAFRKSLFIDNDGYRGNLEHIYGEYDFIVNKLGKKGRIGFISAEEVHAETEAPYGKKWHRERTAFIHSCRYMKNSWKLNVPSVFDRLLLFLVFIGQILFMAAGAMTQNWMMLGAGVLGLLVLVLGRFLVTKKVAEYLNCGLSFGMITLLDLLSTWRFYWLRYKFTSKYEYTCHKL